MSDREPKQTNSHILPKTPRKGTQILKKTAQAETQLKGQLFFHDIATRLS